VCNLSSSIGSRLRSCGHPQGGRGEKSEQGEEGCKNYIFYGRPLWMAPKQFCVGLSHLSHFVPANHYTHWYVIMYIFMCIITGQPTLSVGGQAINGRWCLSSSSLTLPGTWAVGRPTLHGGPVQLRPVSATPCYSLLLLLGCIRCGLLLQMSHVAWFVCLCVGQTNVLCKNG